MSETQTTQLTKKDFVSDQAVRWCPGCGDYAILAQAQKQMPTFGRKKEDIVFVSGALSFVLIASKFKKRMILILEVSKQANLLIQVGGG